MYTYQDFEKCFYSNFVELVLDGLEADVYLGFVNKCPYLQNLTDPGFQKSVCIYMKYHDAAFIIKEIIIFVQC